MTEIAKQNSALAIPKELQGFTEAEALGGMNPIQEGYLKGYKYFLTRPSMKGKFSIVNNDTNEEVWSGTEIKGAVIYYAHEVLRLKRGHVESPGKNEVDFTDEENEILAVTYDALKSKGNFEINGYGEYLAKEHADIQGKMRRLYIIMMIPGDEYKTNGDLIAASFSVTTIKSFNALRKSIKAYGMLPLPLLTTNIFFTEAKSESGQEYDRIDFALAKDPKGGLIFAHKTRDEYLKSPYGVKLLNDIILTHKAAVENTQSSGFGSVVTEKEVGGSSFSPIKETDSDEMPF